MNTNDNINKLVRIGLPESEAKVYFYLLKKKNFTAAEIAKLSNVSRSKIYEVLAKLVKRGLCTETLGKVKKYNPVSPEVVFDNIYNEFEEKKKIVSDLSKSLLPLYLSEKENTDPLDYIQVLREKSRIVAKLESLEREAKNEVLSFSRGPYIMKSDKTTLSNREEFKRLKNGIKYRAIYEDAEMNRQGFLKIVEMFAAGGEDAKITNKLPMKMMVFDEKIVILTLPDKITSKPSLTTMIIEHSDLAETLKETFNMYWQKAMTLEEFKKKEML